MTYSPRFPEEVSYKQKEMPLVPSDGILTAYGEQQITINFTAHKAKVYQYQLIVGITGVGADLVRAQGLVPELTVLRQELDFVADTFCTIYTSIGSCWKQVVQSLWTLRDRKAGRSLTSHCHIQHQRVV